MPSRAVYIDSYFSLPTDLAAEMSTWSEFISGHEYQALLRTPTEEVNTSLESDEGHPFVLVKGTGDGPLFFRVLGLSLYALAGHSDDVWPRVMRWEGSASENDV
jgi:hypothetical protein